MKKAFYNLLFLVATWTPLSFFTNVAQATTVPLPFAVEKVTYLSLADRLGKGDNDELASWELPTELSHVSGIKYLGNSRFACIQDEMGSIYIYNTDAGKVEKEIPFSEPGDFEGIAIAGTSAYVVQSNGRIYEVQDYDGAKPIVKLYSTPLTAKHNVEGLTFDKNNNRLLLAIKGMDPRNVNYKCLYAFDLKTKRLAAKPVVKIDLNDPFLGSGKGSNVFQPSAIEIHPKTNDIYILQGTDPKLLVMDTKGNIKKMYTFNKSQFPQAEGLAFTSDGGLFISNEGKGAAATIIKVTL